jgi:hypothetical protein
MQMSANLMGGDFMFLFFPFFIQSEARESQQYIVAINFNDQNAQILSVNSTIFSWQPVNMLA